MRIHEIVQKDENRAHDFFRLHPEKSQGKIVFVRQDRSGYAVIFHTGLWNVSYADDGRVFNHRETETEIRLVGKIRYRRQEFVDLFKKHFGDDVEFIKCSLEEDFL